MAEINLDDPKLYNYILSPDKQITETDDDTEKIISDTLSPNNQITKENTDNKNIILIFGIILILILGGYIFYEYSKRNNIEYNIEDGMTHDTRIRINKY